MISPISNSSTFLLFSEEEPSERSSLFNQNASQEDIKNINPLELNALFHAQYKDFNQNIEMLMEHLTHLDLECNQFRKERRISKDFFFKKVCQFAEQINAISWPPDDLKKSRKPLTHCAFRQIRITTFDTLSKVLDHNLQKNSDYELLELVPTICKRYHISFINTHRGRLSFKKPHVLSKKILIKTKSWARKKIEKEPPIFLEKKLFKMAIEILETFNNEEESEIYHLKKDALDRILLKYYPFLLQTKTRPPPPSQPYLYSNLEESGKCLLIESMNRKTQQSNEEPPTRLNRKIRKLQSQLPYVYSEDGHPYSLPQRLTDQAFRKKICKLAKQIAKISEPNSNSEIKELRLDILNRLDLVIESLKEDIRQYGELPSPKPNYNKYHIPLLKLGKKSQLYFEKILDPFNSEETRELYNSMKETFLSREATFSLLESSVSKLSCYQCCGS